MQYLRANTQTIVTIGPFVDVSNGYVPETGITLSGADEAELIAFCKGKIAGFKIPRHVRFVEAWPISSTKIQKFRLQEQLVEELGL